MDPSRTGFIDLPALKMVQSKADCVDHYLASVLNGQVVFIESKNYAIAPKGFTFARWIKEGFEGHFPDFRDFETHLSLHFRRSERAGF